MEDSLRKSLNKNQKGELDAVIMYRMLAKRMKTEKFAAAMERLAGDEQRHADAFKKLTGDTVKSSKLQGIAVCAVYRIIGRKKLFKLMAKFEYAALEGYKKFIPDFPELESVRLDEGKHGDALISLSEQ